MKENLKALLKLEDQGLDLDLFYNISVSTKEVALQGNMSYDTLKTLGEKHGIIVQSELDSGFLRGNFEVDEVAFRVTLT
jgi:hypothetical protein